MPEQLYDFGGILVCRPSDILWVDLDCQETETVGWGPWKKGITVGPSATVSMKDGEFREFYGEESVKKLREAFAKYTAEVAAKLNAAEASNA